MTEMLGKRVTGDPLTRKRIMPKLTESYIESLPVDGADRTHFDTLAPGFGVRITPAGKKIFIARARAGGRRCRVTIGTFPEKTVAEARREARAALDDIRMAGTRRWQKPPAAPLPQPARSPSRRSRIGGLPSMCSPS